MIKATDVIGKPIISKLNGEKIDDVSDLIYDSRNNRVRALLVDKGGWFSDAKVIMVENVASFGKDAVLVENPNVVHKADEVDGEVASIAKESTTITQTKIITEEGTELGKVSDLMFDPYTGVVESFVVSQGLKNVASGKKYVNVSDIVTVGKDATIVSKFTEEIFNQQAQSQGVMGRVTEAKGNLPNKDQVMGKANELKNNLPPKEEVIDKAKTKLQELKDAAMSKVDQTKGAVNDNAKKSALGKYLKVNILAPDDTILANRGDMITNELLVKAEQAGLLTQVVTNASTEPVVSSPTA